ncbi:hypothetical protein FQA39_LY06601 [Lamprigera yunnana]|nr:hypothetical protein FQA39_LY06601 [Lamprigera yunnana]
MFRSVLDAYKEEATYLKGGGLKPLTAVSVKFARCISFSSEELVKDQVVLLIMQEFRELYSLVHLHNSNQSFTVQDGLQEFLSSGGLKPLTAVSVKFARCISFRSEELVKDQVVLFIMQEFRELYSLVHLHNSNQSFTVQDGLQEFLSSGGLKPLTAVSVKFARCISFSSEELVKDQVVLLIMQEFREFYSLVHLQTKWKIGCGYSGFLEKDWSCYKNEKINSYMKEALNQTTTAIWPKLLSTLKRKCAEAEQGGAMFDRDDVDPLLINVSNQEKSTDLGKEIWNNNYLKLSIVSVAVKKILDPYTGWPNENEKVEILTSNIILKKSSDTSTLYSRVAI